jgi:hypothetical protein
MQEIFQYFQVLQLVIYTNNNSYRFNKLGSSGIADTLLSSNAATKQAPNSSFTAVSKISIEAKAPSIIL